SATGEPGSTFGREARSATRPPPYLGLRGPLRTQQSARSPDGGDHRHQGRAVQDHPADRPPVLGRIGPREGRSTDRRTARRARQDEAVERLRGLVRGGRPDPSQLAGDDSERTPVEAGQFGRRCEHGRRRDAPAPLEAELDAPRRPPRTRQGDAESLARGGHQWTEQREAGQSQRGPARPSGSDERGEDTPEELVPEEDGAGDQQRGHAAVRARVAGQYQVLSSRTTAFSDAGGDPSAGAPGAPTEIRLANPVGEEPVAVEAAE